MQSRAAIAAPSRSRRASGFDAFSRTIVAASHKPPAVRLRGQLGSVDDDLALADAARTLRDRDRRIVTY